MPNLKSGENSVLQFVCFDVRESPNKKIIYYFHSWYRKNCNALIIFSRPYDIDDPKHLDFLSSWLGITMSKEEFLELDFTTLQEVKGENALIAFTYYNSSNKFPEITKIAPPEEDSSKLYIKPAIRIPRIFQPNRIDLSIKNAEKQKKLEESNRRFRERFTQ